jgi:hypothetical protein
MHSIFVVGSNVRVVDVHATVQGDPFVFPVADAVKGPRQLFSSGFVFLVCVFFGIPLFQYTAIVGLFVVATVVVFGIVFVVVFVGLFVGLFVGRPVLLVPFPS